MDATYYTIASVQPILIFCEPNLQQVLLPSRFTSSSHPSWFFSQAMDVRRRSITTLWERLHSRICDLPPQDLVPLHKIQLTTGWASSHEGKACSTTFTGLVLRCICLGIRGEFLSPSWSQSLGVGASLTVLDIQASLPPYSCDNFHTSLVACEVTSKPYILHL